MNEGIDALHSLLKLSCQSSCLGISKAFDFAFNSEKLHKEQEIFLALLNYQIASGVLFAYQLKLTKSFVLAWQNMLGCWGVFFEKQTKFLTSVFHFHLVQNTILKLFIFTLSGVVPYSGQVFSHETCFLPLM